MSDCRLTTFEILMIRSNSSLFGGCLIMKRIQHMWKARSNLKDDMSDKEIDEEHERAVEDYRQ